MDGYKDFTKSLVIGYFLKIVSKALADYYLALYGSFINHVAIFLVIFDAHPLSDMIPILPTKLLIFQRFHVTFGC